MLERTRTCSGSVRLLWSSSSNEFGFCKKSRVRVRTSWILKFGRSFSNLFPYKSVNRHFLSFYMIPCSLKLMTVCIKSLQDRNHLTHRVIADKFVYFLSALSFFKRSQHVVRSLPDIQIRGKIKNLAFFDWIRRFSGEFILRVLKKAETVPSPDPRTEVSIQIQFWRRIQDWNLDLETIYNLNLKKMMSSSRKVVITSNIRTEIRRKVLFEKKFR